MFYQPKQQTKGEYVNDDTDFWRGFRVVVKRAQASQNK